MDLTLEDFTWIDINNIDGYYSLEIPVKTRYFEICLSKHRFFDEWIVSLANHNQEVIEERFTTSLKSALSKAERMRKQITTY